MTEASGGPGLHRRRQSTPLQRWLDANGFSAAHLAKEIEMPRQSLQQIREGRDCRLSTARRVLGGFRRLARRPVRMSEIFGLEPEERENPPRRGTPLAPP